MANIEWITGMQMTEDSGLQVVAAHEPRLILFDCDGTLMDSHHHIVAVMLQAFEHCGMTPPDPTAVLPVIGMSLSLAVQRLLPQAEGEVRDAVVERYRHLYRTLPAGYGLFDGVRETLIELGRRGYWLGIVTGKSHAGLLRVLDDFELGGHFLVIRTSDHCPSKPHPAMVEECMAEMGVTAGQTTVIGDALLDMQMARNSGARALGVSFGVADGASLLAAGALAIVDEFDALLEHFPPLQSMHPLPTIRV